MHQQQAVRDSPSWHACQHTTLLQTLCRRCQVCMTACTMPCTTTHACGPAGSTMGARAEQPAASAVEERHDVHGCMKAADHGAARRPLITTGSRHASPACCSAYPPVKPPAHHTAHHMQPLLHETLLLLLTRQHCQACCWPERKVKTAANLLKTPKEARAGCHAGHNSQLLFMLSMSVQVLSAANKGLAVDKSPAAHDKERHAKEKPKRLALAQSNTTPRSAVQKTA